MENEIKRINDTIRNSIRGINQTADLQVYELAESIAVRSDDDVTFPALVLPDGECYSVYGEADKHDAVLYHKLNDISYQEDNNTSIGSVRGYTQVADVTLIVYGKRDRVDQYRMEKLARNAIAHSSANTLVRSDFNALQIFANEYAGVTYFLGSAYYLFKINYRITSTYNPRCN